MKKNGIMRILTLSIPGLLLMIIIINTMQNRAGVIIILFEAMRDIAFQNRLWHNSDR